MKGYFLILGYPRSRTAWLANFLSYGHVSCGHEMLADCEHPRQWFGRLPAHFDYAGSAETAGAFAADQLFRPGLKIALIWRDPAEVAASLSRLGLPGGRKACDQLAPYLERAAKLPGARVFRYDQLGLQPVGEALLEHVAPGEPFAAERWKMLTDLNIQITEDRHHELAALAALNAAALLTL